MTPDPVAPGLPQLCSKIVALYVFLQHLGLWTPLGIPRSKFGPNFQVPILKNGFSDSATLPPGHRYRPANATARPTLPTAWAWAHGPGPNPTGPGPKTGPGDRGPRRRIWVEFGDSLMMFLNFG